MLVLVLAAGACHASQTANNEAETALKACVSQMMQIEPYGNLQHLLTTDLLPQQQQAHDIINCLGNDYMGFEWNTGVLDVCGDTPQTTIQAMRIVDATHAQVDMRYVDRPCYDLPYTMFMLREDGQWKIDDILYAEDSTTLRQRSEEFCQEMAQQYTDMPIDEIMDCLLTMEPSEHQLSDPAIIYHNNPQALRTLARQLRSTHELVKANPGYNHTTHGKALNDMVKRIEAMAN